MRLITLRNGAGINPEKVIAIVPKKTGRIVMSYWVDVVLENETFSIDCEDWEDAQWLAEDVIRTVNIALL